MILMIEVLASGVIASLMCIFVIYFLEKTGLLGIIQNKGWFYCEKCYLFWLSFPFSYITQLHNPLSYQSLFVIVSCITINWIWLEFRNKVLRGY